MERVLANHERTHVVFAVYHTCENILRTEVLGAIACKHLTFYLREETGLELNTALHTELISESFLVVCSVHTFFHTFEECIYKS